MPFYTFCLFPRVDNFTAPGPTKIKQFHTHEHLKVIIHLKCNWNSFKTATNIYVAIVCNVIKVYKSPRAREGSEIIKIYILSMKGGNDLDLSHSYNEYS
jgi:hypothetical protein